MGGDELLGANAFYAADLLRTGNLAGLARHVVTWNRSYRFTPMPLLRSVFWTFGMRPLAVSALERTVPGILNARRVRRSMQFAPSFIAPDDTLRADLERRTLHAFESTESAADGLCVQNIRQQINRSFMDGYLEQSFERGRRLGVRFLHPLWDADLADMLYRTPQRLLYKDGRSKFLIRRMISRRCPGLGLDHQKKMAGTQFFRSVLAKELPGVWKSLGGELPTLTALGVIDRDGAKKAVENALQICDRRSLGSVWELVKLEAWAQSRI
jgi:hypothetical protein